MMRLCDAWLTLTEQDMIFTVPRVIIVTCNLLFYNFMVRRGEGWGNDWSDGTKNGRHGDRVRVTYRDAGCACLRNPFVLKIISRKDKL